MTKELPPSRTAEQFVVRFPDGMRDRIAEEAKKNNRSMNAEIVARLQDSFKEFADSEFHAGGSTEQVALSQVVQELESLQRLGSLTYELQRATYKADTLRPQLEKAWHQLQHTIENRSPEDQQKAKAEHAQIKELLDKAESQIRQIEDEISAIHQARKVSGLKELRDVQPVYAVVRGKWKDTGVAIHDASIKKTPAKRTPKE